MKHQSLPAGSIWYAVVLGVALLAGMLLRLVANDGPFPSSDHAELAAIVTFFYPRSLSLGRSWEILTSVHGTLPPLVSLISTTVIGLAGISITEWWWNLPFALLGVVSILVAARFAEWLAGWRAGMITALLVAVLPIHAVLSRASGLAHITLMGLCQLVAIWCFMRYYEQPTPARARAAGLSLSVALLVELFFPVLLALLFAIGVLSVQGETGIWKRLARTRQLFSAPAVLLAPLLIIVATGLIMIANTAGLVPQGGTFSRLFAGSDRQAGVYLGAFWSNGVFTMGGAGFVVLLGLGALGLPSLIRLERRAVPLLWAIAYLLPFVVFTRGNVYGYFLMGAMGLALNAAIVLSALWEQKRPAQLLAGVLIPALAAVLLLRSLSIIFGISTSLSPIIGEGIAQGGVYRDQGLKAAAWWLRTTTSEQTLVFADGKFEPYQIWYYVRRPAIAITDAVTPEEPYQALADRAQQPQFYIVPPDHESLLYAHVEERPQLLLAVTENGQPILNVYGPAQVAPPTQLEASAGNQRFDQDLGGLAAMVSAPEE